MAEEPFGGPERTSGNRSHGLVGPLMLILVGIALLLNQLDIWKLDWSYVWRLWPLILILMGLDIILRRVRMGWLVLLLVATGIVVLVILFLPSALPLRSDYERETFSFPAKGVEAATIHLEPGVATLEVLPARDSSDLIELEATYDRQQRHLAHSLDVAGDEAKIHLWNEGDAANWQPLGSRSAETWRVWLDPDVPLRLEVDTGVGRAHLDLTDLTLTRLDLNAGVGEVAVVLSDKGEYEAFINGGIGSLTVEIPETMEASIRLDRGIGSVNVGVRYELQGRYYVTPGYKSATKRVDVDIDGAIGSVTIR